MRSKSVIMITILCLAVIIRASARGGELKGTLKLGGVFLDEVKGSDLSPVQETYNIHEGFSVSQIRLNWNINPKYVLLLNLTDLNLDNRKGRLELQVPGRFKVFSSYDQNHQVFDPNRTVESKRKDWRFGARITPKPWIQLSGDHDIQTREGGRMGFPAGVVSQLGNGYDYTLQSGRVEAEARKDSKVVAVAYDYSVYTDHLFDDADRSGKIISARVFLPCFFTDKLKHMARGAYGIHELTDFNVDYRLKNLQYTGVLAPVKRLELRYNFSANRIDNESTGLTTDEFRNNFDATYRYRYGSISGGYGYETNDDDRSSTNFNAWRTAATFLYPGRVTAKIRYANRSKEDVEKHTLLRDSETSTLSGKLDLRVVEELTLGGRYTVRRRDLPDIDVEIEGLKTHLFVRYDYRLPGDIRGNIYVDYSYADDEYDDRVGSFDVKSHIITSRVDSRPLKNVKLVGGVTWVDIRGDLEIEKAIIFFEGTYTFRDVYHIEAKYNIYNYDDYILTDRYYTANVFWINFGYDFQFE